MALFDFLGSVSSPNPNDLINQQARLNRIGTSGPFGTTRYIEDQGGSRNDTRLETTLSPQQQAILDELQRGQLGALQTATSQLGNFGDPGNRARIEQAYVDRALGLLGPEFARQERTLQQRLANQGLGQASGAYNREYGRFEEGRANQLNQIALDAILQGGTEESRLVSQILALMGQGQVQLPDTLAPGQINVLDPYALQMKGDLANQAFTGEILGGILGLGGKGIGAYASNPAAFGMG